MCQSRPFADDFVITSKSKELKWSGRKDLNLRPPGPEPGALARLRYAPNLIPCSLAVYAGLAASATIAPEAKRNRREAFAPRRRLEEC